VVVPGGSRSWRADVAGRNEIAAANRQRVLSHALSRVAEFPLSRSVYRKSDTSTSADQEAALEA
jgi:hypothetical protein